MFSSWKPWLSRKRSVKLSQTSTVFKPGSANTQDQNRTGCRVDLYFLAQAEQHNISNCFVSDLLQWARKTWHSGTFQCLLWLLCMYLSRLGGSWDRNSWTRRYFVNLFEFKWFRKPMTWLCLSVFMSALFWCRASPECGNAWKNAERKDSGGNCAYSHKWSWCGHLCGLVTYIEWNKCPAPTGQVTYMGLRRKNCICFQRIVYLESSYKVVRHSRNTARKSSCLRRKLSPGRRKSWFSTDRKQNFPFYS